MLCSHDEVVRREALGLLGQVRELHTLLLEAASEQLLLQQQQQQQGLGASGAFMPLTAGGGSTVGRQLSASSDGTFAVGGGFGAALGGVGATSARSSDTNNSASSGAPGVRQLASVTPGRPPLPVGGSSSSLPALLDSATSMQQLQQQQRGLAGGVGASSPLASSLRRGAGLSGYFSAGIGVEDSSCGPRTYLVEVVEESGADIVRDCYWVSWEACFLPQPEGPRMRSHLGFRNNVGG